MPEQKRIVIKTDRKGQTTTEFFGFVGVGCLKEAEEFRRRMAALGVRIEQTERLDKPELEQALLEQQQQQVRGVQQQ